MRRIRSVLRVRALKKEYRHGNAGLPSVRTVLQGVDLDVYDGDVLAVVGPSGVGKSTLLLCLSGLLRPTAGLIQWALPHAVFGGGGGRGSGIVYVPERVAYYDFLTVRETLEYYGMLNGAAASRANCGALLDGVLERVGLTVVAQTLIKELPGSMIRRLQMAQALMDDPKVLLLDETLSGVDVVTFNELREVALECVARRAVVVVATWNPDAAQLIGTRTHTLGEVSERARVTVLAN